MYKKISLLFFVLTITLSAFAQSKKDGIKFYKYKKYQSAIKALEPLAAEDAFASYYLGLSYIETGDLDKAKSTFQKHADNYANMAGLARVSFEKGNVAEANAMLEKVTRKTSRKNKAAYLYAADAITYTNGGDLKRAIEYYDYYLEWKPSAKAHIRKGDAYRKMRDGGNAMTSYQRAERLGGSEASLASFKQGNLWYASQTFDSALVNYQRAADADPQNPLPYNDLANAYYKINRYKEAKENIEKYLALSDQSAEDQVQYANILYLADDYDGAINKMSELLASGNGKSYMYRILGYSYFEKNNIPEAIKNMELLFKNHPKKDLNPKDYFTFGKILSKDSVRAEEAMTFIQQGIDSDTMQDKVPLYRQVADGFKDSKEHAKAAMWYKKITQQESPLVEALDYWNAGTNFYQVRDYQNATDMFTQMTVERPDASIGFYWLGKVGAAQDPKYKLGTGVEGFAKFQEMVKDDESRKGLRKSALVYLTAVAYNKQDYTQAKSYANMLLEIDPGNSTATQIMTNIPK